MIKDIVQQTCRLAVGPENYRERGREWGRIGQRGQRGRGAVLHSREFATSRHGFSEVAARIQHLFYGTGYVGGFAGDDEFETVVRDEGYVRGGFFGCHGSGLEEGRKEQREGGKGEGLGEEGRGGEGG